MILVDIDDVTVSHARGDILRNVSLTIDSGQRLGVVGHNGAGKSTLLHLIIGDLQPDGGHVRRQSGVRVSSLPQRPTFDDVTAIEAVGDSWEAAAVLDRLGLGGRTDDPVLRMSGGEQRRVALARALVTEADLLVLDEPTNHLDIDAIDWLEERLRGFKGGLVCVSHDRHMLDALTTRMLEVDGGALYVHDGGYREYLSRRNDRLDAADKAESVRKNLARREQEWLKRGAPARTRKSKAHIKRAHAVQESGITRELRDSSLALHSTTPRLGDTVIELTGVGLQVGDRLLVDDVDLIIGPDERLGIVGPNGTGKSTLLDALAKRRDVDRGEVRHGTTVSLGYFDQLGRELDPSMRVIEAIADGREPDWRDKALLEQFWFDSATQRSPIERLSGGERRRLQLVLVLAQDPNVLLLDEPTNDLDLDTLRALEDFLDDWPGALICVSHDRAFLERVVDDVIVVDESTDVRRVAGGLAAWVEARRSNRRRGHASTQTGGAKTAAKPSRSKPKSDGPSKSTLRHRVKELDKQMARQQRTVDELTSKLAETASHEDIASLGTELHDAQSALDQLEEQWVELSLQLEG